MFNAIIRFSLNNRLLVLALSVVLLAIGGWQTLRLPVDVFPDLTRPRVVVMTEAHGMAPEEVETLITIPIETSLNGAPGVETVRSSSAVGMSVVYAEFEYGTATMTNRQIVTERLSLVADRLPEDAQTQLAPVSSIMGQISIVGMYRRLSDKTRIFATSNKLPLPTVQQPLPVAWKKEFDEKRQIALSNETYIAKEAAPGGNWEIVDPATDRWFAVRRQGDSLEVHKLTSPMEMRTLADWVIRPRLLTIPGVSQVFVMGGGRKQFQVLLQPHEMLRYGVTLDDITHALEESNENATGGYLDQQGPEELLVRALGRLQSLEDVRNVVVQLRNGRPVLLTRVAKVVEGPQVKRGDSSAYVRQGDGFAGGAAVVMTINKQPGADTRQVTQEIAAAAGSMKNLPPDIAIATDLYEQKQFIDLAIDNVIEALRDGAILVAIILFLFLLNFRTTVITLTAIPLSIVITAVVFAVFGLSINTMTLGGLAVAIGELVDDAIVDVENIFRRLRENRQREHPQPALKVVYLASLEVRNSIVFGTLIVVLAFVPLFALGGMEGRLFTPLGVAYIVSIVSSLFVSLTLTPVLCYWLLGHAKLMEREQDGFVLRFLKWVAGYVIRFSLWVSPAILVSVLLMVLTAGWVLFQLERDFLPPFNEGSVQINVSLPPGTSLAKSNEINQRVEAMLRGIPDLKGFVRKTGRAELDEHAEGVNTTEIIASFAEDSKLSRDDLLTKLRGLKQDVPGIVLTVEQPISHLISHMLSGVKAQVAIKLYGDDLDQLRRTAETMKNAMQSVPGVVDAKVQQQVVIPQLRIEVDRERLQHYGLQSADVTHFVETAMNGEVLSQIVREQRTFDLMVRMNQQNREDIEDVRRLQMPLPSGGMVKLESVAKIYRAGGPNMINREQVRRLIVVSCNTQGRGMVDVVADIRQQIDPLTAKLPAGYFVEYGGQFESQQSASRTISILFVVSLAGMFLVLYSMFRSVNLSLQVMIALPMAFIGSVAALTLTGQTLTVASMVGFVSLCGIASRNGILLINHYLHLVQHEGEDWTGAMIVRAGQERLAPVLMTALTSGIGLAPLAMAAGEPGKEILYPVATVIIGGLISSTLLEFLVRPALFWTMGIGAARHVVQASSEQLNEDVEFEEPQSAT